MKLSVDIRDIAGRFCLEGEFLDARLYGSGHIHDTFRVKVVNAARPVSYIFQKINQDIFRDPPGVMENIVRVTNHIRRKLADQGKTETEISREVLSVVPARDHDSFYRDLQGNYWRCYEFITDTDNFDELESPEQGYQVAFMFGRFLEQLSDLPGPPLHETIPDFHNGPKRFKDFREALDADVRNRAAGAVTEIDFLLANRDVFDVTPRLASQGKLPLRVTHNDTKVNNVMLARASGKGVCVIDLDTVMPGVSLYDFGDLARTTLSSVPEDAQDPSAVAVDLSVFKAIVKGFLRGAGAGINTVERDHLVFAARMMTQLIGMRFLTDHLMGDTYFKVRREGHNLDRCRRQFKMVRSIVENEERMRRMVEAVL